MQQSMSHSYSDQVLAVIAALKTVYFLLRKIYVPNNYFSYLKHFRWHRVVQILVTSVFSVGMEEDSLLTNTASDTASVRGFQKVIAAALHEELDRDLLHAIFSSLLIDKSTDIATDHNLVMYVRICVMAGL